MKLRHPWLIRLVAFLAAWLIRIWMSTLRYRIVYADGQPHPADPRRERFVYAFWHEALLFPTLFRSRIYLLISRHADGELIARVCRHLGARVVRGSTTRGGGPALLHLVRCSRHGHLGVTPDGPRGPRRRVQPGVVFLASCTGLPIVAFGVGFTAAWRARSWDRLAVPLPFSTALCVVAPHLHVPAALDRRALETYRLQVEEYLLQATEAAERWAATGKRPKLGNWRRQVSPYGQAG